MDLAALFLGGLGASLPASGIAYVGARRIAPAAASHRYGQAGNHAERRDTPDEASI
jgi:hypothetical protein